MATTSLLIIFPDSSWKNSYEFSKITRTLKVTWAGLFFLDFLSAHCFPSEGEFFACRRNFGARACPARSLPRTPCALARITLLPHCFLASARCLPRIAPHPCCCCMASRPALARCLQHHARASASRSTSRAACCITPACGRLLLPHACCMRWLDVAWLGLGWMTECMEWLLIDGLSFGNAWICD